MTSTLKIAIAFLVFVLVFLFFPLVLVRKLISRSQRRYNEIKNMITKKAS